MKGGHKRRIGGDKHIAESHPWGIGSAKDRRSAKKCASNSNVSVDSRYIEKAFRFYLGDQVEVLSKNRAGKSRDTVLLNTFVPCCADLTR